MTPRPYRTQALPRSESAKACRSPSVTIGSGLATKARKRSASPRSRHVGCSAPARAATARPAGRPSWPAAVTGSAAAAGTRRAPAGRVSATRRRPPRPVVGAARPELGDAGGRYAPPPPPPGPRSSTRGHRAGCRGPAWLRSRRAFSAPGLCTSTTSSGPTALRWPAAPSPFARRSALIHTTSGITLSSSA